jgi:hypothetical protein
VLAVVFLNNRGGNFEKKSAEFEKYQCQEERC